MKKLILPALGMALIGLVSYGVLQANADDNVSNYPPIVQKLIERFGLNEDEVDEVIGEFREEHRAQLQNRFEEKLVEAVENGTITQEQQQLILEKHEELRAEREANWDEWKNMSREARWEVKQERHTQMEVWAEENGMDLDSFFIGKDMRGGHREGMKGGFGWR